MGGNGGAKVEYIDLKSVRKAKAAVPGDRMIRALAETFAALSDPTRVRIIFALSDQELCVFDLSRLLGLTGSAVSHQLRLLRGQRLVRYRKEGKVAYYSLDDDHIRNLMEECVKHVSVE
ncbi:MAG TPA: transcriptional regulator [Deltaproteobacteria bacterium]|nr:transcriptional regulator [Deltaproteobacteria bacterium]